MGAREEGQQLGHRELVAHVDCLPPHLGPCRGYQRTLLGALAREHDRRAVALHERVAQAGEVLGGPPLERDAVEVVAAADVDGDQREVTRDDAVSGKEVLHALHLRELGREVHRARHLRDAERAKQAHEDARHVLAVGVDDSDRVEPPPPLAVGVEADALRRAGEEGHDRRELHELLEVDDQVVAARPHAPDRPPEAQEKQAVAPRGHAEHAAQLEASIADFKRQVPRDCMP